MRDATRNYKNATIIYNISIHASHAGRDVGSEVLLIVFLVFQSTRPMRDATESARLPCACSHFNPRVPCGTRRRKKMNENEVIYISIHASHAGRDSFIFYV